MEYLQYFGYNEALARCMYSFKPCYKWNTFNTIVSIISQWRDKVLNLVINGIPSIL